MKVKDVLEIPLGNTDIAYVKNVMQLEERVDKLEKRIKELEDWRYVHKSRN
jgi:polyhydroxyalkanoate synthesis regulator phasin